ncbi:WD40 repeat domain-containing protein [Schlesneria paludicola]|uniref:WD40 repeat domain-containing protein n=1 Tax=Schlesneria paludicola TaxID=360056 RepID=UPI00029AF213|nr:c-type cytochrome domain-containing protein [Schlesneria paludicola]
MWTRVCSLAVVCSIATASTTAAESKPDFNQDVLPVFRKYCIGCHNPKDAEAGLVLQDYQRSLQGGSEGTVIVAGKSDASRLWKRMTASDDTRMPPLDQKAPTSDELATVKTWIDSGALAPEGSSIPAGLVTPKIKVESQKAEPITSVAASPGSYPLFVLARPHDVEVHLGDTVRKLEGHAGTVNEVRFSVDGKWLCVSSGETGLLGEATLWRTSDWERGPVVQGHRDAVYSAELSADGKTLATASYDRELITWDVKTRQPIKTFRGHNDAIYSVGFSPNGKLLATASGDRTVKLWDVASGLRLDTFAQPAKEQTSVVFSPDGQLVVAGGVDCRIRVWQISETGREGTNPIRYARFAHEGPILKLVFSPNGKLLASSSEDRRIKIWETKTFTQVAVLERQPDWVSAMAFTAGSDRLLVGRMNGDHQLYPIDSDWADAKSHQQRLDETVTGAIDPVFTKPMAITEVEPNDALANANSLPLPGVVKGILKGMQSASEDVDFYRITATRGQQWVFETDAARSGSLADTKLELFHVDGRPVLRAMLQAVRDSWVNFRPIDSSSPDVRLEFWEEMDLNQYVYMSGEVCKTFRAPQGPDSGYQFYASEGKRRNYFDTSAAGHAKDEPAYIVEAFAPSSKIVENGLPVFPLYFANDDDGERKLGKDSRLLFTAPTDGEYLVRVSDVRGFGGEKFAYTLIARRPDPNFAVKVTTMNPKVPAGSGQRVKFALSRIDGFDESVRIDIAGLPKGFVASSPIVIQPGLLEQTCVLTAAKDAPEPTKEDWERVAVLATADAGGRLVTKMIGNLGEIKLEKPAPIRVMLIPDDPRYTSDDQGLVIEPGTTITAKIVIERNGHEDDVRFDVDNLPHGIIVDNIGLSGVLVRKQETERQIFLTARSWVPETDRLIHAVAQVAGNQASPAIRLRVRSNADAKNRVAGR